MKTLACLLVLVVAATALPITDRGKKAIVHAYEEYKQLLNETLQDAHPSVLVTPLKQLRELKEAGKANLDRIAVYGKDVDEQLTFSTTFWEQKMAEVIKPYVTDPEKYKYLIIDFFPVPADPDWNQSPEYVDCERVMNSRLQISMDQMNQTYAKQVEKMKATVVKDAIASAWGIYKLTGLLRDTQTSMEYNIQYAKRDAANGDCPGGSEREKKAIRDRENYFNKTAQSIYQEYLDATDN